MKHTTYPLLLLAILFLGSCKNEKDKTPVPEIGGKTIQVESFNKVNLDGNVVLNIHYSPGSAGEIKVNAAGHDLSKIILTNEDGELFIRIDDKKENSEAIIVDVFVANLTKINLENDQHAIVNWDRALDKGVLHLTTEADSRLELYNLNTSGINSKQEGASQLFISSAHSSITTPITYTENVSLVDKNSLETKDNRIIKGDSVVVNTLVSPNTYTVYGKAKIYNLIQSATFRGEGKSKIEIAEMPIKHLNIKLEGESTARVWVTSTLSGKGEGGSVLQYFGNPNVTYNTSGAAQLDD